MAASWVAGLVKRRAVNLAGNLAVVKDEKWVDSLALIVADKWAAMKAALWVVQKVEKLVVLSVFG
jgi:hypothetical protein